jgi:CheY-like chemotaxis protein
MESNNSKTILVVDDQFENLKVISDIFELKCPDFNILNAPNGKIALKIIDKKLPDLIITDWEMPEMSGIELIRKLKQNTATSDIPIIMCTGIMTDSKNLETALSVGATDYI